RQRTGAADDRLTVFENLQSFALRAPRELLEAVLACPEIASAMANQQPESLLIEPVPASTPSRRTRHSSPAAQDRPPANRTTQRRSKKSPPSR
ncbi:MAG: hypothetical protein ACKOJF_10185, partial [Planctomycetaceae bacterium]